MNAQEIFDTVATHLAAQGCQSLSLDGSCAYRGKNGRKCAVGILITDEEYSTLMEGKGPGHEVMPTRLGPFESLLWGLQASHDDAETGNDLHQQLRRVAAKHNLSTAILDTLQFPEVWS